MIFGTCAFAFLAPPTIAAIGLRLRRPRPDRRELVGQPGSVACIGAGVAILVPLLDAYVRIRPLVSSCMWGELFCKDFLLILVERTIPGSLGLAGFGIALTWSLLAAGGRWRAEPSRIDRLGRFLGLAWIAAATARWSIERW